MKAKLLTAVIALVFLGLVSPAWAAGKVRCEVLTIQASNTGGGIDPGLKAHEAILKKVPFSAYNTYRLIDRQKMALAVSVPKTLKLPKSLSGTLQFTRKAENQLALVLTISRKGEKPIRISGRVHPNAPFFAAGFQNQNGAWVFGVICNQSGIENF